VTKNSEMRVDDEKSRIDGRRVLVVDDDSSFCAKIRDWLECGGHHQVTTECSAEGAMAAHHPQSFDVCLLDYHLAGVNGVTLGAMIRACNPDVRLVLMSGSCDARMRQLAFEHGFSAAIAKPVRLSDLSAALFEPAGRA